jgi:outer membrane protein OmpA-like peptidoglycan-associated protein
MYGRGLIACAALLLSGCAGPSLLLLPDEGGGQGAVAVLEARGKSQETLVSQGNSRTRLGRARPVTRAIAARGLRDRERALLDNLPPPPATFTLYFVEGSTRLVPDSRPQLDALRAELAQRTGAEVQVTGHTDTLGATEDNDALSRARAREILDRLAMEGIDPALMTAVGRGERELKEPTEDGVRHAANRRVEVIVR